MTAAQDAMRLGYNIALSIYLIDTGEKHTMNPCHPLIVSHDLNLILYVIACEVLKHTDTERDIHISYAS